MASQVDPLESLMDLKNSTEIVAMSVANPTTLEIFSTGTDWIRMK
jgi:hypothetical protein